LGRHELMTNRATTRYRRSTVRHASLHLGDDSYAGTKELNFLIPEIKKYLRMREKGLVGILLNRN